ncbi:hypothetical protein CWE25_11830 [Idiomarina fontislapidosi]|uniref:Uncharacterized protein n=1 Tax=Idiomarina fontislapidosi TaxID=263723 RepID=A0A432XR81_9GAMM|nr:hypothetical protein CWE25_11830 [Idiomarina fontislapidosi]
MKTWLTQNIEHSLKGRKFHSREPNPYFARLFYIIPNLCFIMTTLRATSCLCATLVVSAVIAVGILTLETMHILNDVYYLLLEEVCLRLMVGGAITALISRLLRAVS